ncbi:hypothetical protein CPC08DRAFT_649537 [Agrocybe pediades]|nr:hypothetical protein CPC08DRAFT_649537 [Agrocybe pediades]
MPLCEADGKIWGVLAGQVDDEKYWTACDGLYQRLVELGQSKVMQEDVKDNKRGAYPVLNIGVTYGPGASRPSVLHARRPDGTPGKFTTVAEELLQDPNLRLLASFQSYCYSFWCPNIYRDYVEKLNCLWDHFPDLRRNFSRSVFPCCALNCGPDAWTKRHRDCMNRADGWCAITALGSFNPTQGGHLLLPELRLAIQFPPGSVILIPSATVTHANIPVAAGDVRGSITQYAAGGLFRFIDNNFMTKTDLQKKDEDLYKKNEKDNEYRWLNAQKNFSSLNDFTEPAL